MRWVKQVMASRRPAKRKAAAIYRRERRRLWRRLRHGVWCTCGEAQLQLHAERIAAECHACGTVYEHGGQDADSGDHAA